MNKYLLTCLLLTTSLFLGYSQTVQWATEVIEFSSELTPVQYSSNQVLGKPNVLPRGGESPNGWTPDRDNRKEFIKVGFENPIKIKQIAIGESYHPSAITAIYVYDEDGHEIKVSDFTPQNIPIEGRMLNVFYETTFKVTAVKIELDGALVTEYFSLDAVAISDSDIQIVAEVDVPDNLASGVVVDRMSENINSEYKEYKPVLSPDGKTMYFSRKNHPENVGGVEDPEDIWYSVQDENGQWMKAENMGTTLNTAGPNFISSVTPDGNSAILILGNKYLDNGEMEAGVSVSSSMNGEWSKPIALTIDNDYNFSEKANYYLANSRKTLLMSVEREDSNGDRDLYVSFMKDDSTWTEPLNLGNVVNTASEESAPYLAADDQTLYFSSNGFSGYGGMDIYMTKRLDDTWTNWSDPQNMGPEINSEYEDVFFNVPSESNFAYYSRGVNNDDTDIFKIELPVFQRPEPTVIVQGKLKNSKTQEPLRAVITYERLSDGKELGIIESNPETGEYELVLPIGEMYGIHAESEGFMAESQNIDLRNYEGENFKIENRDLSLTPLEVEQAIVLNNIFFNLESAILKSESFPELNRLVEIMEKNPAMKVQIEGYTDTTGPENFNLWLSEKRAESVATYLKDKGVSADRLTIKFFGEANPRYSNDTFEGRKKNRRVEFKILEK